MPLENPQRQINPHPSVTIRQCVHAMHILLTGAMHAIEQSAPDEPSARLFARSLIDQLEEDLDAWAQGCAP